MLRRLKLFQHLQEVKLSPEDILALMQRVETDSCSTEDYEVWIKIVRAHTAMSADLMTTEHCRVKRL